MNTSDIRWKINQHKDFIRYGIKYSIIKDLLSKEYSKVSFESWEDLPIKVARSMGCEFTSNTPVGALREIFVDKIYDVNGFVPMAGDVVCDIGASYGDSAIWWSKVKGATVLAFEPLKDIYEILEANISMNKADVSAFNIAIGSGKSISSSREQNMLIKSCEAHHTLVETKKLDDLGIKRMNILKIDVEGFELDVLNGAIHSIEKLKPRIIIETHSTELRNSCDKFLRNMGYSLEVKGRKIKPEHSWMDVVQNLFYAN